MRRILLPLCTLAVGIAAGRLVGDGEVTPQSAAAPARTTPVRPDFPDEGAERRGLRLVLRLHGLRDEASALYRDLPVALEAGVDGADVMRAIESFPRARRRDVLTDVMASHPDLVFDAHDGARILERAGDAERALAVARAGLRSGGFDGELARMLLRLDPDGAPRLIYDLPEAADWMGHQLATLMEYFGEAGRPQAIVPFLERALEDRRDGRALELLGRVDPDAALDRARDHIAANGADRSAWMNLGRIEQRLGNPREAFDAFDRASRLAPDAEVMRAMIDLHPERALRRVAPWAGEAPAGEALAVLALACARAGHRDEAAAAYARGHGAHPDESTWIEGLIDVAPQQAAGLLEARIALLTEPDADLLGTHARALQAAGRRLEAFGRYLEAHRSEPGESTWQIAMAEANPGRALAILEGHLEREPRDASAHGARGLALLRLDRRADAVAPLRRAMETGRPLRWFDALAGVDADAAFAALRERAERDDEAALWGALGRALEAAGRPTEAGHAYRRAVARAPRDTEWLQALRAVAG
jgi:tetratricopeptide (TPR) repeat protein